MKSETDEFRFFYILFVLEIILNLFQDHIEFSQDEKLKRVQLDNKVNCHSRLVEESH